MKTTVAIFIFFIIAVALFPFLHLDKNATLRGGVVTSNFALYDISKALLVEDINVTMLVPVGADLHTFEPTPKDVIRIKQSDFFIYSGANIEHYLENFHDKNSVDMSQHISLLSHAKEEHSHHDAEYDPHYWLDINNMITMTYALESLYAKKYVTLVPKITQRAETYTTKLKQLQASYRQKLSTCKLHTIVLNHNAYAYLAHEYHFSIHSLSGLSSDARVNAKTMSAVVQEIKQENIPMLFYDAFESAKEIQTLSKELTIPLKTLNTLGNITHEQFTTHQTYYDLMQDNLNKLSEAMECK